MFALAVWDRAERALHLVRDRFGEKPLYYGRSGGHFLFGSELKALRAHPGWQGRIDRGALTLYFRFNYVPAPFSIYEGIHKLLPGHIATVRAGREPDVTPYWSLDEVARDGLAHPLEGSDEELVALVEDRLRRTIAEEMVADVPLGALLSGGIDSSVVVALMQTQSPRPIRTFTIGFHEADFNEATHAKAVAAHLGTDHTELYVAPAEAQAVIPRLPELWDEPFGDSSQIPTFLVSELARRQVTVALSGDGGDEMFGGYNRYFEATRLWSLLRRVPAPFRHQVARGIRALPPSLWDGVFGTAQQLLPRRRRLAHPGDRMHKLADTLAVRSGGEMYRRLVSHWQAPASLVVGGHEPEPAWGVPAFGAMHGGLLERMMYLDARTYLPDDIMVKVDRATMAVSLESRAPFLDHRVAELAWRLPSRLKVRGGVGKWVLRQVLYRHVPPALVDRPKMGFGVPIARWLRGPLREWADALLSSDRLVAEGYLRPEPVARKWQEHLSGVRNRQYPLWDVLMFQAWLEEQRAPVGTASAPGA
jgi:asparagine synthase (glutamine-hydrolysing)